MNWPAESVIKLKEGLRTATKLSTIAAAEPISAPLAKNKKQNKCLGTKGKFPNGISVRDRRRRDDRRACGGEQHQETTQQQQKNPRDESFYK